MFIIIGYYFTHNFTGACLSRFVRLSVDVSLQLLVGPKNTIRDITLHTRLDRHAVPDVWN
jgi:hypothetical protein